MKIFKQILLKIGTRPPGHILGTLSCWHFVQIDDFVDQNRNFRSQMGKMGIFWLWRQLSQLGLLGAPSYSRHVFFGTLLGVCWGVHAVFTLKTGRELAICQARMKKSVCCLCQFRLFFFRLTFTGGNPWPKLVPAIPFGMKPGVFFCQETENVFCLLTTFIYNCFEVFKFGSAFYQSFKFFLDRTVHGRSVVPQVAFCSRQFGFFKIFSVDSHEMFCALYILNFQHEQIFKNLRCGLENATSLPYDVIIASAA